MRSFNLTIQPWGTWFDIYMSNSIIFDVPMKLSLELYAHYQYE